MNQTYKNIELIIVNDCSTDNTKNIVEEYLKSDQRVKLINNDKNLKLPRTLNNGFQNAKGDFLTWTSDDNIYKENAIEEMLDFLNSNQKYDFVYTDYEIIDEKGEVLRKVKVENIENIYIKDVVGACFLYKRKIFDDLGGFDPNWFLVEDYEYWLRCASKYNMQNLHKNLYSYREHKNSLSATKYNKIIENHEKLVLQYLESTKNLSKKIKAKAYMKLFLKQRHKDNYDLKWDFLKLSIKNNILVFFKMLPKLFLFLSKKT